MNYAQQRYGKRSTSVTSLKKIENETMMFKKSPEKMQISNVIRSNAS